MNKEIIQSQLTEALITLQKFQKDYTNIDKINTAAAWIAEAISRSGKIISCGNGGSMCDAMHFAEELSGRYRENRKSLPAIAISDPAHITCVGNDYGFEQIFSRFIEGVGKSEDILFAISTSGNSQNIINAIESAKTIGMKTIVLTGNDGGKIANISDLEIRVPHKGHSDRIQEIHIKIIHILIFIIEGLILKK